MRRTTRDTFRCERKIRKRDGEATDALKGCLGTNIDLLPESEEDARRVRLVNFGDAEADSKGDIMSSQAIFTPTRTPRATSRTRKPIKEKRTDASRKLLLSNTGAVMNTFDGKL